MSVEDDPAELLVSEQDGILEVTLNRPKKLNALTLAMTDGLFEAVTTLRQRPDLRVMLILAQGRYFSAGIDLSGGLAPPSEPGGASGFRNWYRSGRGSMHPLFDEFEAVEKPIVVAHHATCLGGAMEMSLSCDFRLAAKSARYGLPETAMGALPGSGGISRLTRLVGPHWARWFVMAGLQMDADRALAIGLVHDVYPDEEFLPRVRDFCRNLAKQPFESVAAAKLAIELSADLDRGQARNVERLAASSLVMGDEYCTLWAAARDRFNKG